MGQSFLMKKKELLETMWGETKMMWILMLFLHLGDGSWQEHDYHGYKSQRECSFEAIGLNTNNSVAICVPEDKKIENS